MSGSTLNITSGQALMASSPRRWWPVGLGLTVAVVQLVTGVDRVPLAITVVIAALCYLAAAAWGRPWVAWAAIPAGSLLVAAAELSGVPWWVALSVLAVGVFVVGLLRSAVVRTMLRQSAAMVGFTGLAVAALAADPQAGLVLAGLVLASHGIWDVAHLRRGEVVSPSLAQACLWLDVPLGLGAVALAVG